MFGSQALETAIGLAAMFFIIATAASSVTESISRITNKRAGDLEKSIGALMKGERLKDENLNLALDWFKDTSVWKAAQASAGRTLFRRKLKRPSYLSAKMFADAVTEMLIEHRPATTTAATAAEVLPENLKKRLDAMVIEGRHDLISLKSGLEGWFDEAMARAEGSYKRWATLVLFLVGLGLAVALNLSTTSVASQLWTDPVTREAVVNSSAGLLEDGADASKIGSVAEETDKLKELKIPGGWSKDHRDMWFAAGEGHVTQRVSDGVGWLLTAILVMLGAPFWFDLLGRFVSVRGAGTKPAPAEMDGASATAAAAAAVTPVPASGQQAATVSTTQITPAGPASEGFAKTVGLIP